MRRLLAATVLVIATAAAMPAAAWDRHGPGHGWRPAPSWHQPPPRHGWHRPWRPDHGWRDGPRHGWRDGWRRPAPQAWRPEPRHPPHWHRW